MFFIPFEFSPAVTVQWLRIISFNKTGQQSQPLFLPVHHMLGTSIIGSSRCLAVSENVAGIHETNAAFSKLNYRPKCEVKKKQMHEFAATHPVLSSIGKVEREPFAEGLPIYYTRYALSEKYSNVKAMTLSYRGYMHRADIERWLIENNMESVLYQSIRSPEIRSVQNVANLITLGKIKLDSYQVTPCNNIILQEIENATNKRPFRKNQER